MTTPITVENLESAGFSDTLNGTLPRQALGLNPSRDFKKGNLVVRMWGSNRIAWTWSGEELGPVSNMHQVLTLDGIVNHDIGHQAVTSDLLLKAGWRNDGFGRYFMGSIAINMQGDEDHFTVFTSVGLSKVVLGRVSTMSEVEALTAIASRTAKE